MNEKFWITAVQLSGAIMTSFSVLMLAFYRHFTVQSFDRLFASYHSIVP